MRMTFDECLSESARVEDSLELAEALRAFSEDELIDKKMAYYMREAADNLEAHFKLTRSMAAHLALLKGMNRHAAVERTSDKKEPAFWTAEASINTTPVPSDKMIRLEEVEKITGLKRSSLYNMVRNGSFPRPVKAGRLSLYLEGQVRSWMAIRIAESKVR